MEAVPGRFEVVLKGLVGNEVRITGGTASLGHWDPHNSVPLQKCSGEENVWFAEMTVSPDTPVEYRYLVTAPVLGEGLRIVSWEASPRPRVHTFTCKSHIVRTEYGVNQDGSMNIEDGWLLSYSELQVHLGTRGPALSLPGNTKDYLLKAQAFSISQAVECPMVRTTLSDRATGECLTIPDGDLCSYTQGRNIVGFTCHALQFTHTGLHFDICDSKCVRVGRASLHPHQLSEEGRGFLTLTVFSEQLESIGSLSLSYLVIKPFDGVPFSLETSHCRHWGNGKMLHIGHRGSGDSHHTDFKTTLPENTVASLTAAYTHGADYVELDVHLTKDLVPVIFHNFTVCEGGEGKPLVNVKELTLSQLHSSTFQQSSSPDLQSFSTLAKVLEEVPQGVGFNLEIKYPLPEVAGDGTLKEDWSCFPINQFADTLLTVINSHSRGRRIIFSSFNPDMCSVIRLKQPVHPVLFLTSALNPKYLDPQDLRAHTLRDAIAFTKEQQLLGIVCDSKVLLEDPKLVGVVKGSGLVLLSWGDTNNSLDNIRTQEISGVDGVIYDCIDIYCSKAKQVGAKAYGLNKDLID